jgi:hypothetical protein
LADPGYATGAGHAICIIGWKTISGVKYWICQNSWADSFGDYGYCYIRMDYGYNSSSITNYISPYFYNGYIIVNGTDNSPSAQYAPTLVKRVAGGFNTTFDYADNTEEYQVGYALSTTYTYSSYVWDTNLINLTGLAYGTTYNLKTRGYNHNGYTLSGSNPATTAPYVPTCTHNTHDNNSITVNIGVASGNWSFVKVWYRPTGGSWSSIVVNYPATSGTITGLSSGQQYEIKASSFITVSGVDIESVDSNGSVSYSSSINVTTSSRPANWSWSVTISSNGTSGIVMDNANKRIKILTATEINNFCTRINDFRTYKSLATVSFATQSQYGAATASFFNQMRTAINDMSPSTGVPSSVTSGVNKILASSLNGLRDSLNSIT